jgi:hypothetical protein
MDSKDRVNHRDFVYEIRIHFQIYKEPSSNATIFAFRNYLGRILQYFFWAKLQHT